MRFLLIRYILVFLILVTCQNVVKCEEIKEDVGKIKGFIGPQRITASELKRTTNSLRDIIALDKGKEKADETLSHLEEEAWLQLALLHQAQQQGIQVLEREVDEFIHNNRRFQINYRFNSSRYQTVLSQLEIDPYQFHQTVKDWLLIDKLLNRIRRKVTIDEKELRKAFWKAYELRKVNYVIFPLRKYMSAATALSSLQGPLTAELQEEISQADEKSIAQAKKYHNHIKKLMRDEELLFQKAARKLDLEVKETGYFSRNVPPAGIQQPDWIWSQAFLISKGELSSVVPVREGYLFFSVSEIFLPTEKQYSRGRRNFLLSYRKHKEEELIREYKKNLLGSIRILDPSSTNPTR